jgi:Flp pilus assembly protein TadG
MRRIRKFWLDPIVMLIRALGSDRSAVVALEFAFIGPVLLALILVSVDFGLLLFARAALDSGTQAAARTIQIGQPNAFPKALCDQLPSFMNCAQLSYYVQQGSSFGRMNPTISYNANGVLNNGSAQTYVPPPVPPSLTGTSPNAVHANPYVIVQVSYKWTYLTGLVATLLNASGVVLVSTAAFEHE